MNVEEMINDAETRFKTAARGERKSVIRRSGGKRESGNDGRKCKCRVKREELTSGEGTNMVRTRTGGEWDGQSSGTPSRHVICQWERLDSWEIGVKDVEGG